MGMSARMYMRNLLFFLVINSIVWLLLSTTVIARTDFNVKVKCVRP